MANAVRFLVNATYHVGTCKNIYQKYFKFINFPKNENFKVMDIGCASGRVLQEALYPLIPKNCSEILATDYDKDMIKQCAALNIDPKIKTDILDMQTTNLPEKFINNFDYLFSSNCLHYTENLRQAFLNSHQMLKPKGELVYFFFYKINRVFTAYRKMYESKKWENYTQNYKNFKPHFLGENPEIELENLMKSVNFNLLNYEFIKDLHFETTIYNEMETFLSMDFVRKTVPENLRQNWDEDFKKYVFIEMGLDENNINEKHKINYPTVVIHARKE